MARLTKQERAELFERSGKSRLFGLVKYIPPDKVKAARDEKQARLDAEWAAANPGKAARKAERDRQRAAKKAAQAAKAAAKEAARVAALPPVVVRVYKEVKGRGGVKASVLFERDAPGMVADGYKVANVEHTDNKTSKTVLFGAAGYFAPDEITVTYVLEKHTTGTG